MQRRFGEPDGRVQAVGPAAGQFKRKQDAPLDCDLLVADKCSMIDVPLANQLLKAVPSRGAVIFVGDADQLPSVGPGQFLTDLIASGAARSYPRPRSFVRPPSARGPS